MVLSSRKVLGLRAVLIAILGAEYSVAPHGTKQRGRKAGNAAGQVAAKKKAGRPRGAKTPSKRGPGRPGAAAAIKVAGLDGIEAIVSRMVEQQIGAKIGADGRGVEKFIIAVAPS